MPQEPVFHLLLAEHFAAIDLVLRDLDVGCERACRFVPGTVERAPFRGGIFIRRQVRERVVWICREGLGSKPVEIGKRLTVERDGQRVPIGCSSLAFRHGGNLRQDKRGFNAGLQMNGAEAIGEAVSGGLAARAFEPDAGEQAGQSPAGACLNCGTALIGPHCHQCGQPGHVHRTIAAWWHDLAHGVLHLDGKIWRTLPLLAWRPGELTRRYIAGERARFVSPLALFLFSVFLMFAVFSALGPEVGGIKWTPGAQRTAEQQMRSYDARIGRLQARRTDLVARHASTETVDENLAEAQQERQALALTMQTAVKTHKPVVSTNFNTGIPGLDQGLARANENPALLLFKLQSNAYKFSWALIPISLPFLWLLFLHRRRYRQYKGYDHLVFVTYSIAFMSLAVIAAVLLRSLGLPSAAVAILLLVVPPVHIFRQLRGAYALGWFSALWRTMVLLWCAAAALVLFLILLLTLGVMH